MESSGGRGRSGSAAAGFPANAAVHRLGPPEHLRWSRCGDRGAISLGRGTCRCVPPPRPLQGRQCPNRHPHWAGCVRRFDAARPNDNRSGLSTCAENRTSTLASGTPTTGCRRSSRTGALVMVVFSPPSHTLVEDRFQSTRRPSHGRNGSIRETSDDIMQDDESDIASPARPVRPMTPVARRGRGVGRCGP